MKESVEKKLNNIHELEFTLFCIESLAEALHKDGASVYQELSSGKNFLQNYIIPEYGVLHTQGKEYILQELLSVMKEWGGAAMNAHPVLLQKKYARIIAGFAEKEKISLENALDFFYKSELYQLISQGISDMHCRSDLYLIDELEDEYKAFQRK